MKKRYITPCAEISGICVLHALCASGDNSSIVTGGSDHGGPPSSGRAPKF